MELIFLILFINLQYLCAAEQDTLFEMAFGELFLQIILGDGFLNLRDGFTCHYRLVGDTASTEYENIARDKPGTDILLFLIWFRLVDHFLGH